jgi:hypothetical protein
VDGERRLDEEAGGLAAGLVGAPRRAEGDDAGGEALLAEQAVGVTRAELVQPRQRCPGVAGPERELGVAQQRRLLEQAAVGCARDGEAAERAAAAIDVAARRMGVYTATRGLDLIESSGVSCARSLA